MNQVRQVPLRRILKPTTDSVPVQPDGDYRIAGIYSFGKGLFERNPIRGSDTSYKVLTRLHRDEFVVSKLNGWEGAVDVVSQAIDGCHVSGEYPVFSIDHDQANPDYLRWVARWPSFWDQLVPRGSMVRRKRVQPAQLLEVLIPLPRLEDQKRQAAYLDAIRERCDAASAVFAEHGSEFLESTLPPLVDQIIGHNATDAAPVIELVDLVSDIVHPGDDPGMADTFVGLQHIGRHTGMRIGSGSIDGLKGRKFRFQPGDIVYGYLRPYLNKIWVADRHGLCSVDQYVLRPRTGSNAEILAHTLRGQAVLDRAIELTHNLQLPRLRSGLLMSLEIPVVPASATEIVASRLATVRDHVLALAVARDRQLEAAQALIPAALNHVLGPA